MMNKRRAKMRVPLVFAFKETEVAVSKSSLNGEGGRRIWDGSHGRKDGRVGIAGRRDTMRSRMDGLGGGARNAIAKSAS